jgi:hypothetical protein
MEIFLSGQSFIYPIEVELLSKASKKFCISLKEKEKRNIKARLSLYLNLDFQKLKTEFPVELRVFHIENWDDYEQYWTKRHLTDNIKCPESKIKTDKFILRNKKDFKKLLRDISSYKYSLSPSMFELVFTLSPIDFKYNEVW